MEKERVTKKGIKLFTLAGMNTYDAKALMRVMLFSALSVNPLPVTAIAPTESMVMVDNSFMSYLLAALFAILCISLGYIMVLRSELYGLRGEARRSMWDSILTKVLSLLKKGKEKKILVEKSKKKHEGAEEEVLTSDERVMETPQEKFTRYMANSMDEVNEPDLWQWWHHAIPSPNDPPSDHRRYCDDHMQQMMRDTNELLKRRRNRLEREYDGTSERNDLEAMEHIDQQINECVGLMYNMDQASLRMRCEDPIW